MAARAGLSRAARAARSLHAQAERLGPDASAEMANTKGDARHFNEKGIRAMAGLVMRELPVAEPKLKEYLKVL